MATISPPAYTDEAILPDYTNSIDETAHVLLKPELTDPTTPWSHRQWYRIELQLQGTQILLQQELGPLMCERPLSLQGAQAGLATDYHKKPFVFRVRVEGYQFLCAAASFAAAVSWVDALNAAIAVSGDLDERQEPRYRTMAPNGAPTARNLGIKTSGAPKLRRIYRMRRLGMDAAWLSRRFGERGSMEMERYLEDETRILTNQSTLLKETPTTHCVCSACYNSACTVGSLDSSQCKATKEGYGTCSSIPLDAKEVADAATSQGDRVDLAWRRLEYARRCAKTLTYRTSWVSTRYLRGQTWVDMKAKDVEPNHHTSWAAEVLVADRA